MTSQCATEGCGKEVIAKGLCRSCYNTARAKRLSTAAKARVRACALCGMSFSGRDRRAIYCSKQCNEKAHDARRHPRNLTEYACIICGKRFTSYKAGVATCSTVCSWKWQNKKNAKKRAETHQAAWQASQPTCPYCGKPVPNDRRVGSLYCSYECKKKEHGGRWREQSPGYMRWYVYKLTQERYEELLAVQGDACAICRQVFDETRPPSVDHDHACCPGKRTCGKCTRRLLCSGCNNGLRDFEDDPSRLAAALAYLTQSPMTEGEG